MRGPVPRRASQSLAWAAVFCLVLQVVVLAVVDGRHPELYDPEYGQRLALLQARRAEQPGRPLLLLCGSSRTVVSFKPEVLPPIGPPGRSPLVFNFSHCGAGPLMELMLLDRLLREGIRPDWLVVEVLPPKLVHEGLTLLVATAAGARDLPLLGKFLPQGKTYGRYLLERVISCRRLEAGLLGEYLPDAVASAEASTTMGIDRLGGCSWLMASLGDAERERQRQFCRSQWSWLHQERQLSPESERALRALLDRCRNENIPVALVLSPEGREFQDLYSPEARAAVDHFCDELRRAYGVPVIDARNWLADGEFLDSHHVLRGGAEKFTRRLAREVLQPLVEDKRPGGDR
jgi:hypothetical protein